MSPQTGGSKGTGMTRMNENLKKRKRIFHADSIPTVTVNSEKKPEITTVKKRMANAGHAAMTVFFRMSCAGRATGKTFMTAIPYYSFTGQNPSSSAEIPLWQFLPLYTHALVKYKDLKIISYPQFHPIIVLFFAEFGV